MDLDPESGGGRLTIGRLMAGVAGLAVILGFGRAGTGALPGAGAVALLGAAWLTSRRPDPSRARLVAEAALAAYLPGAVGLTLDCSHCVAIWLRIWPVVPGLWAPLVLGRVATGAEMDLETWLALALAAATAAATIFAAAALGRWAGRGRWAVLAGLALASAGWSVALAAAIRS